MQRLILIIMIALVFTISCSSNDKKKKKKKFEPAKIVKIQQTGKFNKLWSHKLDGSKKSFGYKLVPFVDSRNVYVATQSGKVSKFTVEEGKKIWEVNVGEELSAGPGVGNDILVVGTPEGNIIALDLENGTRQWTSRLTSEILSPPVIDNQIVVVRAQDGRVYGLQSNNGDRIWSFDTNIPNLTLRGNSKPVVRAGRVYIGFDNGKVAAIKQETGEVIWLQSIVSSKGKTELARIVDIDGDMALVATDLYLSSADGKTIAVATESGRVMWSKDMGSAAGVTASRSNLFIIDNDSNVHALNRSDGIEEWKTTEYKNRLLTKPVFYLGDIMVGDLDGYIHVLNGDNGRTIARARFGKSSYYSPPVNSGSMLVAYNKDGTLTAFEYTRK